MNFRVSKTALQHWFLIYLAIIFQGSILYKIFDHYIMILVLVLTALFIILGGYKKINDGYVMWAGVICGLILLNHFVTHGSTSIGTVGNFFTRFCIAFLAVELDKKNFRKRFLEVMYFLSVLSLLSFVICLTPAKTIFHLLPTWTTANGVSYYGGLFIASPASSFSVGRNIAIFGEPGVYQILINVCLWIMLFDETVWLTAKKRKKYLFVFIISIIAAQSAAGYLGTLVLFASFVFSTEELRDKRFLKGLILVVIISFIAISILGGSDNFVYERFTSKIFSSGRNIDLSGSTGRYRVISIQTDLAIAANNPLGVGTENYKIEWLRYVKGWATGTGSVVGATNNIAQYGYLCAISMYIFLIQGLWRNKKSIAEFIAMLGIICATVFSQPHILYAIYIIMAYPMSEDIRRG